MICYASRCFLLWAFVVKHSYNLRDFVFFLIKICCSASCETSQHKNNLVTHCGDLLYINVVVVMSFCGEEYVRGFVVFLVIMCCGVSYKLKNHFFNVMHECTTYPHFWGCIVESPISFPVLNGFWVFHFDFLSSNQAVDFC